VGITSRSWTFGDGGSAGNVVAPSYTYAAAGTYNVSLTVVDGGGLTNTKTVAVTVTAVSQPPVASFTVSCVNLTCTLDASASTPAAGIVLYSWDLGKTPDGTATGKIVTVDYPHPSTRTVTLTVTDGGGLTNSTSKTFTVP
jgi:PKD repeat protein